MSINLKINLKFLKIFLIKNINFNIKNLYYNLNIKNTQKKSYSRKIFENYNYKEYFM